MEINFNGYIINDNKKKLPIDGVLKLLGETSWAKNRKKEVTLKSLKNSICIGVYKDIELIGFARIVTDYATMYWLADMIIEKNHRKKGLGKKLVEIIINLKELEGMFGILSTLDTHGLYEKYGFQIINNKIMWKDP